MANRPDADWTLRMYIRALKEAACKVYAETRKGVGRSVEDIIREFRDHHQFDPDLSRFGFTDGYGPNMSSLTEDQKWNLAMMMGRRSGKAKKVGADPRETGGAASGSSGFQKEQTSSRKQVPYMDLKFNNSNFDYPIGIAGGSGQDLGNHNPVTSVFDYDRKDDGPDSDDLEVEAAFSRMLIDPAYSAPLLNSPPPGWDRQKVGLIDQIFEKTSVTVSISVGSLARAVLRQLWRRWPHAVAENKLLDLLHDDPKFTVLNTVPDAKRNEFIAKIGKRMRKFAWRKYLYIEKSNENLFMYKTGLPSTESYDELGRAVVPIVARVLYERGQKSVHYLVNAIGVESKDGWSNIEVLDGLLRKCQPSPKVVALQDWNPLGQQLAGLTSSAGSPNWHPEFPESFSADLDSSRQPQPTGAQSSGNQSGRKDTGDVKKQPEYKCKWAPLFTILHGNEDHINRKGEFKVDVLVIKDLNTFWVRTAEDEAESVRLTDTMDWYFKTEGRSLKPMDCPVFGDFACYRSHYPRHVSYSRARIIDRNRTTARVEDLDKGGLCDVPREDIFPLPDIFRNVPPLATRCSIGLFEVRRDCVESFNLDKDLVVKTLQSCRMANIKIHSVTNDSLVVDLKFEDESSRQNSDIPRQFLNSGAIRML